eukprot:669194-Rhodomonas_salina.4
MARAGCCKAGRPRDSELGGREGEEGDKRFESSCACVGRQEARTEEGKGKRGGRSRSRSRSRSRRTIGEHDGDEHEGKEGTAAEQQVEVDAVPFRPRAGIAKRRS